MGYSYVLLDIRLIRSLFIAKFLYRSSPAPSTSSQATRTEEVRLYLLQNNQNSAPPNWVSKRGEYYSRMLRKKNKGNILLPILPLWPFWDKWVILLSIKRKKSKVGLSGRHVPLLLCIVCQARPHGLTRSFKVCLSICRINTMSVTDTGLQHADI